VRPTVHFLLYVSSRNDEFTFVTAPITTSLITPLPLTGQTVRIHVFKAKRKSEGIAPLIPTTVDEVSGQPNTPGVPFPGNRSLSI